METNCKNVFLNWYFPLLLKSSITVDVNTGIRVTSIVISRKVPDYLGSTRYSELSQHSCMVFLKAKRLACDLYGANSPFIRPYVFAQSLKTILIQLETYIFLNTGYDSRGPIGDELGPEFKVDGCNG
jgi:hypothetical protein